MPQKRDLRERTRTKASQQKGERGKEGEERKNRNRRMSMSEEVIVCKYVWEKDIAGRKMREEYRKRCSKEGKGLG